MNAPERPTIPVPDFLARRQPPAEFALFSDGRLLVAVGEQQLMLAPEDIRNLDRFMGTFQERRP